VRVRACRLSDIEDGKGLTVEAGDAVLALFRSGSEVWAIDNDCPHRGGALACGDLRGTTAYCPLHAWPFDVRTGQCLEFPEASVRSYRAELCGGEVWVEL
jgi:nitrite reductase (NADH) small subunit